MKCQSKITFSYVEKGRVYLGLHWVEFYLHAPTVHRIPLHIPRRIAVRHSYGCSHETPSTRCWPPAQQCRKQAGFCLGLPKNYALSGQQSSHGDIDDGTGFESWPSNFHPPPMFIFHFPTIHQYTDLFVSSAFQLFALQEVSPSKFRIYFPTFQSSYIASCLWRTWHHFLNNADLPVQVIKFLLL